MHVALCKCKSGCTCTRPVHMLSHPREGINFVTVIGTPGPTLSLLTWRKSGRSNASGNCVEIAKLPEGTGIAIRNSRNPDGPTLVFTNDEIAAFVDGVRDGDFDDLVA